MAKKKTPYEQAKDQTKAKANDPLRVRLNELRLHLEQSIKELIREHGEEKGVVNFEGGDQFEIEGRDDLVVAVEEQRDGSTEGVTSNLYIITEFENEETSHDAGDMSTDDLMNIYEALRDR